MAGLWDDWLSTLRTAQKGPVTIATEGFPAATRGLAWATTVEIAGDWTDATLEGSIRESPDAVTELATFAVSAPSVADGYTTFTASLASGSGANSTGVLPSDSDLNGVVELPMMFRLTPAGGDEDTLFGGLFTVLGIA